MCVQYIEEYSVHWGGGGGEGYLEYVGDVLGYIMIHVEGYQENICGRSVHWGDIMSTLGDVREYIGNVHEYTGDIRESIGECNDSCGELVDESHLIYIGNANALNPSPSVLKIKD